MNKKQIVTTAVVVAILGLLVYLQVQHWRSFDWARFRTASHVSPLHIAAAIALIYVTYVLRAWRWKVFLEPVCKSRTSYLVSPTFVGFTGLALLGRPGEFIRPVCAMDNVGARARFSPAVRNWTLASCMRSNGVFPSGVSWAK